MNEAFLLYLFTRLDAVKDLWMMFALISAILVGGTMFGLIVVGDEGFKKYLPWTVPLFLTFAILNVVTPSSKDMAIIVGGTMALRAAQTPEAKALGGELYDAVMSKLREESGKREKK